MPINQLSDNEYNQLISRCGKFGSLGFNPGFQKERSLVESIMYDIVDLSIQVDVIAICHDYSYTLFVSITTSSKYLPGSL